MTGSGSVMLLVSFSGGLTQSKVLGVVGGSLGGGVEKRMVSLELRNESRNCGANPRISEVGPTSLTETSHRAHLASGVLNRHSRLHFTLCLRPHHPPTPRYPALTKPSRNFRINLKASATGLPQIFPAVQIIQRRSHSLQDGTLIAPCHSLLKLTHPSLSGAQFGKGAVHAVPLP